MKIVAITACPTGIAHTYMAADALSKAAHKMHIQIKVETQGAMGIENQLTAVDIASADVVLIASDIDIEDAERLNGKNIKHVSIEKVLTDVNAVLISCQKL